MSASTRRVADASDTRIKEVGASDLGARSQFHFLIPIAHLPQHAENEKCRLSHLLVSTNCSKPYVASCTHRTSSQYEGSLTFTEVGTFYRMPCFCYRFNTSCGIHYQEMLVEERSGVLRLTRNRIRNLVYVLNVEGDIFSKPTTFPVGGFSLFCCEFYRGLGIRRPGRTMKLSLGHLFRCPDAHALHFVVIMQDTSGSLSSSFSGCS